MSINSETLNLNKLNKPARQRGLTLIEIMVALLIGSFLLAGVIQIFIVNKQTYRVQENLSRMQENGRFAMNYLNRYIRLAGYITDGVIITNVQQNTKNTMIEEIFKSSQQNAIPANGGNRAIIGFDAAGLNVSDNITVRFQANPAFNPMIDCLGNVINSPNGTVIATNQFLIPTGLQDNNLHCRTVHNNANGGVVFAQQTQPIVEGVENMQIRYCMRTPPPTNNISCVVALNPTSPDWDNVQSVRISLLLRSADNNLVNAPQPYQFDANGDGDDEMITPTDRRLRRVFTTTITLRNLVAND